MGKTKKDFFRISRGALYSKGQNIYVRNDSFAFGYLVRNNGYFERTQDQVEALALDMCLKLNAHDKLVAALAAVLHNYADSEARVGYLKLLEDIYGGKLE